MHDFCIDFVDACKEPCIQSGKCHAPGPGAFPCRKSVKQMMCQSLAVFACLLSCSHGSPALQRIEQYDKSTGLNSVREINPSLVALAAERDEQLAEVISYLPLAAHDAPISEQTLYPILYQHPYMLFCLA